LCSLFPYSPSPLGDLLLVAPTSILAPCLAYVSASLQEPMGGGRGILTFSPCYSFVNKKNILGFLSNGGTATQGLKYDQPFASVLSQDKEILKVESC